MDCSSESTGCKRKRNAGRKKIAIEQIQNEAARQVCFSKRRSGLFNKAHDLVALCGAHITIIAFSPGGKAYPFVHPSECHVSLPDRPSDHKNTLLSELCSSLEAARKKNEELKKSLCGGDDVASLDLSVLEHVSAELARRQAELDAAKMEHECVVRDELAIQPYLVPAPVPIQPYLVPASITDELPMQSYFVPMEEGYAFDFSTKASSFGSCLDYYFDGDIAWSTA